MLNKFLKDPFRLFFPLGILIASLGLFPWLLIFTDHARYPVEFHRVIMINGFVLSFASGFLMTAIPRFTKTEFAKSWELLSVFLSLVVAAGFAFQSVISWHYFFAALTQFSIFLFAARRFVRRQADPPVSFTFVGLGLGLWLSSNLYFFLVNLGILSPGKNQSWGAILSQGAILSLILGIGSRLIPALLGWQEVVTNQQAKPIQKYVIIALTMLLLLSYFFPIPEGVPYIIRSAIVLFLCVRYWKIHRFPKTRNWYNWNLWMASWFIFLSQFLYWVERGQTTHFLHFLFVGGFAWMTLLISLHVGMAHQPAPDFSFKQSKLFLLLGSLILLATLTRVSAILVSGIYLHHLGYAAATLLVVLILWLWMFFSPRRFI